MLKVGSHVQMVIFPSASASTPTALMIIASASIKVTSFFIKIQSSSFLVVFFVPSAKTK